MSRPNLPVITLHRGPWTAEVYDPRPDPATLGARYVHGCYVRGLRHRDRLLTARIADAWSRFDGEGLPETFETSLGWGAAPLNEEYLRIGAGRLRRLHHSPRESTALVPLVAVLEWRITAQEPHRLAMTTQDELLIVPGQRFGYVLEREVELVDEGLVSRTRLTLRAEAWQGHPLVWYAHPFVPQSRIDGTALRLPATATVLGPLQQGQDQRWRMTGAEDGRAVVSNLWGHRDALVQDLDPAVGGGTLAIAADRPLDHAVVYATPQACSLEPKLARGMTHGETTAWSITYRFTP